MVVTSFPLFLLTHLASSACIRLPSLLHFVKESSSCTVLRRVSLKAERLAFVLVVMAPGPSPYITIGQHIYYVFLDSPASRLPVPFISKLGRWEGELVFATAIEWQSSIFTPADLEAKCQHFTNRDDVWTSEFLSRGCHIDMSIKSGRAS